jgi:transcription termination factor Rho
VLECGLTRFGRPDYTNRIIDLLCPFGLGQRALIVAPAKAGKTMVLQAIAQGIAENRPDAQLLILLVDERPEEVTEMEMCGYGEVVASSFDFPAERHVALAELTLERARRRAELGEDVVIILDSITRLARAYNTVTRGTGRTLSGGLDAMSLEEPKRFLGSARAIDPAQGGGSLTIIGTALVEIAERRIYPAYDLVGSATRREELLLSTEELEAARLLRKRLADTPLVDAMTVLLASLQGTETNTEFVSRILAEG